MYLEDALQSLNGQIPSGMRQLLEAMNPQELRGIQVEALGRCGFGNGTAFMMPITRRDITGDIRDPIHGIFLCYNPSGTCGKHQSDGGETLCRCRAGGNEVFMLASGRIQL